MGRDEIFRPKDEDKHNGDSNVAGRILREALAAMTPTKAAQIHSLG